MKGLKREGLGWRIGRDVVIALGLILILAPLYVVIVNTFKDLEEASKGFFSLPQSLNFQNYEELFSKNNFWNYVKNSAYITVISIILVIIINPAVSYAIARNFRRRYYKAVYFYIILGLFIPFQVIMLPVTKIMTNMNLLNPNGLILLYAALSLSKGVFMFVNYIQSLPYEVEEAARIDGCNTFQVYTKIVLHLIGPMLATLIVMDTLWFWNDFQLPLMILNKSPDYWTLPLFQYNFKSEYSFNYTMAFTAYFMCMFPVLIVYALGQKYIISGLTAGAVKS
ncbi:MAG: sugar ABC transporter permease [Clostridiales bacterium]|nr:carbohydrate ABC transporter permease [Clostridiales bacterium]PWM42466.1 MAG: sugar ABC transporter permease [Clostridiales bacterium]